ncbi:uncharacterized protein LOC144508731 [Mustelus asterias]
MISLAWAPTVCIGFLLSVTAKNQVTEVTLTAFAGAEVLLPCQGTGNNTTLVQIAWKKDAENISFIAYHHKHGINNLNPHDSSRIVFRNNSLLDGSILLKSLQMQDEGMYTCELSLFPEGNHEETMNLTVLVNPINSATPIPATAGLSEVPVARCVSANGNPPAGISWISNLHGNYTTTQNKSDNGTTTVTSLYKVAPTRSTDGQELTCVISHPASQSTIPLTIKLSILYPPEVTIIHDDGNGGVSLKCVAEANPPAGTYSWRGLPEGVETNKTSVFVKTGMNGNVSCLMSNSIGTGNATIEIIFKDYIKGDDDFLKKVIIAAVLVAFIVTVLTVALLWRKRKMQGVHHQNNNFQTEVEQQMVYATLDLNVLAKASSQREKAEETVYADAIPDHWLLAIRALAMSLAGLVLFFQLVLSTVGVTPNIKVGDFVTGTAGDELELPCHSLGDDASVNVVQVTWLKQAGERAENLAVYNPLFGTSYPTNSGRIAFHNASSQNCTLTIDPLELADEGLYNCEVNTFPTGKHESHINLTVLVKPTIEVATVPVDVGSTEAPVATCTAASGKPAAGITWVSKVPGTVTSTQTHHPNRTVTITSQYSIAPTRKNNGETVNCLVSHQALRYRVSAAVTLSVRYPPEVIITGYDGNWYIKRRNVSLSCIAEANPPATTYHWTRIVGPVSDKARTEGNHLFIEQVDYSDNGTWVCEATNALGKGKGEVTIVVSEVDSLNAGKSVGFTVTFIAIGTTVVVLFIIVFLAVVMAKKRRRIEDSKAEVKKSQQKQNNITVYATLNLNVLDCVNPTRRGSHETEATVNTDVHVN